jgi:4-hydroxy-3-methylbut-2-en-1-yl diphosphate synthase IspG/GcpE
MESVEKVYYINCPICGRRLCKCLNSRQIEIQCDICNYNIEISVDGNVITIRPEILKKLRLKKVNKVASSFCLEKKARCRYEKQES